MQSNKQLVVLLHGILLNRFWMRLLEMRLRSAGFDTLSITYPSRRFNLTEIAEFVDASIRTRSEGYGTVHFVAHSMGGLIVRHYLAAHPIRQLGRIVMLGTPNHGSEMADLLKNFLLFRWVYGRAGQQLSTDTVHPELSSGEIGIIAGNHSHIPFSSRVFGALNDGQVAVERTKLSNMKDHIILPCSHTMLVFSSKVASAIVRFLKAGTFVS